MKSVKPSKLHFKGDSNRVVKKKKKVETKVETKETWIPIQDLYQLKGPIIILQNNEFLNYNPIAEKASFKTKDVIPENHDMNHPWVGTQVWICQRIENKSTIRCAFDKYISSTKEGIVSCDRDAAGISETWYIERQANGFTFKNYWGNYLAYDGELKTSSEVTSNAVFDIKTQNVKVVEAKPKLSAVDIELEQLSKYHTKGSKDVLLLGDSEGLLEAKRTGKLHEYLLDRRAAVKKDKFLK